MLYKVAQGKATKQLCIVCPVVSLLFPHITSLPCSQDCFWQQIHIDLSVVLDLTALSMEGGQSRAVENIRLYIKVWKMGISKHYS